MKKTSIFSTRHSIFHIFLVLCILGLFIGGSAAVLKNMTMEAVAADNSQLSYHSISVSMGDTLWSVAKDNYTEEWGSLSVYLKEIKMQRFGFGRNHRREFSDRANISALEICQCKL